MTRRAASTSLEQAWAARVRANREQAERVREAPDGDFYAPSHRQFVADPRRMGDPVLDALASLAQPGDTWLDIGAGAGRYALPLALRVASVIAVDPSPSMLEGLRGGMREHGIGNVVIRAGRWPALDDGEPAPRADVSLIAHVGYDIENIGPFLDAMNEATGRLCVAVMADVAPSSPAAVVWPPVHGEARHLLPGLGEFVALLRERGHSPATAMVEETRRSYASGEDALRWYRNQAFVAPGSAADLRLQAALVGLLRPLPDGSLAMPDQRPIGIGLVTWAPR